MSFVFNGLGIKFHDMERFPAKRNWEARLRRRKFHDVKRSFSERAEAAFSPRLVDGFVTFP
ncbi:protein of unknown function (plasmid) [Cupriavidus taiwanensis]|uniref:Uncharacterized protein n=1 Tax=Cupriavidus taiwanensis TaxID=164546 RepID=A0A375IRJ1_9BURK|nr:protein of unknown function [Cupriavidus taiwanensis]